MPLCYASSAPSYRWPVLCSAGDADGSVYFHGDAHANSQAMSGSHPMPGCADGDAHPDSDSDANTYTHARAIAYVHSRAGSRCLPNLHGKCDSAAIGGAGEPVFRHSARRQNAAS